ncbi:hypothetical protein [Streptomyces hainanensis]|uniref:Secreted protein n=1 Tax=Streptomyces hainanensis TaxID=402648 RepID=A0A4R4TET8_9ACTN|nr:hypothetical protein E1283_20710 [Streptomyces hainanensis]
MSMRHRLGAAATALAAAVGGVAAATPASATITGCTYELVTGSGGHEGAAVTCYGDGTTRFQAAITCKRYDNGYEYRHDGPQPGPTQAGRRPPSGAISARGCTTWRTLTWGDSQRRGMNRRLRAVPTPDADLGPATIAAYHHVSLRTPHQLFQDRPGTVTSRRNDPPRTPGALPCRPR